MKLLIKQFSPAVVTTSRLGQNTFLTLLNTILEHPQPVLFP
jgi:hypothetical protein